MSTLALFLPFQGHAVFDIQSGSSFDGLAAGATALVVVRFIVSAWIGVAIYLAAADLEAKVEGPVALPPALWGLLCFASLGWAQIAAIGLFIFVHFSNWLDPERAWRPRGARTGLGSDHQEKVRKLQEELDTLRAQNREGKSS